MRHEFKHGLLVVALALGALTMIFAHQAAAQETAAEYFARDRGVWLAAFPKSPPAARAVKRRAYPGVYLTPAGGDVRALVTAAAHRNGIPIALAHGVARAESGYRCSARSHSNARGAMQVLPATARSVGISGNLFDCATGIEAGMRYLRLVIARGGTGCAGVSLYERGLYARPVCSRYGRNVLRLAQI
jgi:soluble lytic murein transglycosylase-like protein